MRGLASTMAVPETSVHKNHFTPRCEYEVWFSWEIFSMEAETVAHPVNHAPYRQLGKHSLVADTAHVLAAIHGSQLRNDGLLIDLCGRQVTGSGKGERDLINGRSRLPAEFERADLAVRNRKAYVVAH